MTNKEKIEKRDNFVKLLKFDIDKHLDFDFTRPEMCTAFLDKYWEPADFFLKEDAEVSHICPKTIKEDSNAMVNISIGEIKEKEYEIVVKWETKTEVIYKKFIFSKKEDTEIEYNQDGKICVNGIEKFYIVSRFWNSNQWFLNAFNKNTANFVVSAEVAKAMFPRLGIKNLSDYIDRLEKHLWLPEEKNN